MTYETNSSTIKSGLAATDSHKQRFKRDVDCRRMLVLSLGAMFEEKYNADIALQIGLHQLPHLQWKFSIA